MKRLVLLVVLLAVYTSSVEAATSSRQVLRELAQLQFLGAMGSRNLVSPVCIGTSHNGKPITMVVIRNPKVPLSKTKKIFVICRQHGNEPASTEAALHIIRAYSGCLRQTDERLIDKVTLIIIPMMNPDGADANERHNANDADLNRDWVKQKQPETQAVIRAARLWHPDLIVDDHELDPEDPKGDFIECLGTKAGVRTATAMRSVIYQQLMAGKLRTHGYSVRAKVIADHMPPRLAHRYFPLWKNTPALLVESRQSGNRANQLNKRAQIHITAVMTAARCAAEGPTCLRQEITQWHVNRTMMRLASRGRKLKR